MALVLAYAFDTGSGTTATDASGNGRHGTIVNATWSASGHTSNCLSFDGSGDYVSFPTLGIFGAGASWTLMCWVNATTLGAVNRQIIHPRAEKDLGLGFLNSGKFRAFFNPGAGSQNAQSTTLPSTATWYHVAAVWNNSANTLGIVVDGATEATIALGTPQSLTDTNAIGGLISGTPSQYWDGLIDDVRIFDEALSDASITTYMNTPVTESVADYQKMVAAAQLAASGGMVGRVWV